MNTSPNLQLVETPPDTLVVETIDVSVVVCTYNRAGMLADVLSCLKSLQTRGAFNYELIVVDNASTDETPDVIAAAAVDATIPFKGVREEQQGVSFARNRGIQEAEGEWIAFCDDDELARPDWLLRLMQMATERNLKVVGGAVHLRLPEGIDDSARPYFVRALGHTGQATTPHPYSLASAPGAGNLLLHRSVFEQVGVFDVQLAEAAEDTDLYQRIEAAGITGWYTPDAVIEHLIPAYRTSVEYVRWMSYRHGWSLARQDYIHRGTWGLLIRAAARVLHSSIRHWPVAWWLRSTVGHDADIYASTKLWRTHAYLRSAVQQLMPQRFPQDEFYRQLDFRLERELFAKEENEPTEGMA